MKFLAVPGAVCTDDGVIEFATLEEELVWHRAGLVSSGYSDLEARVLAALQAWCLRFGPVGSRMREAADWICGADALLSRDEVLVSFFRIADSFGGPRSDVRH